MNSQENRPCCLFNSSSFFSPSTTSPAVPSMSFLTSVPGEKKHMLQVVWATHMQVGTSYLVAGGINQGYLPLHFELSNNAA